MEEAGSREAYIQSNRERHFYLPRLPRAYYQGDAVVHWSCPVDKRESGWLHERFHQDFRELMLHAASREKLFCPTYCLMPDHLHIVWMGLDIKSDQCNGMAFLRTYLEPLIAPHKFQHQAHDHVLREHERHRNAFAIVCRYILENPVAAKLVMDYKEWKFSGGILPGYPTLNPLKKDFWPKFWKIYTARKASDAGNIRRPPIQ